MHKFLPFAVLIAIMIAIFSYLPARRIVFYRLGIASDPTSSCCSLQDTLEASGKFDETANIAIFNNQIVDYPKTSLAQSNILKETDYKILGTTNTNGEAKWIEVSLGEQKLRAWEGNRIVLETPISSGLWYPTPTGDFNIWYKTRSQTMKGGSKELGTYYNLPNVPNNMFFYRGFAAHGAYWHNNFGHPMSHGCVNMPLSAATQLFEWSGPYLSPDQRVTRATPENPGTRIYVH